MIHLSVAQQAKRTFASLIVINASTTYLIYFTINTCHCKQFPVSIYQSKREL